MLCSEADSEEVVGLTTEINKIKRHLRVIDVNRLPDKGEKLKKEISVLEFQLSQAQSKLPQPKPSASSNVMVTYSKKQPLVEKPKEQQSNVFKAPFQAPFKPPGPIHYKVVVANGQLKKIPFVPSSRPIQIISPQKHPNPAFQQLYAGRPQYRNPYGPASSFNHPTQVTNATQEAVVKLHKSLETCPAEDDEEKDPKLLSTCLMPHQRKALKWLAWREQQEPSGGIFADDMGLGKTLTMIALILKQEESSTLDDEKPKETDGIKNTNATLVICPASLMHQWRSEVETHCQRKAFNCGVLIYHGAKRDQTLDELASYKMVITTYSLVMREVGPPSAKVAASPAKASPKPKNKNISPLLQLSWARIILDEAHTVKNPKSQTSQAICRLNAKSRWALSGTPIHNNLLDMFALLKFLKCSPFDDYIVWKRLVADNSSRGTERLKTLVKSLLLRRTKTQKNPDGKPLIVLPEKTVCLHSVELSAKEREVFDIILQFSKGALLQMLAKRDNKEEKGETTGPQQPAANHMQLLSLVLRLQQCCNHLSLLKPLLKLDNATPEPVEVDDDFDDLINQLSGLKLEADKAEPKPASNEPAKETVDLSAYKSDPDFTVQANSTKVAFLIEEIKKICKGKADKCVVVSQWTSMLTIAAEHLTAAGIKFSLIQGDVKLQHRYEAVQDFNLNPKGAKVMLLSLKAGGVGLNLIGGNHLFLIDMHWNPALEQQAGDRIYRVGQMKDVTIHRFVCKNTIEEHILSLQEKKKHLASNVLDGGSSKQSKLSLNDLKTLFGVK